MERFVTTDGELVAEYPEMTSRHYRVGQGVVLEGVHWVVESSSVGSEGEAAVKTVVVRGDG